MLCPKIRHHSKPVYSDREAREAPTIAKYAKQELAKKERLAKIRQKIDRGLDQLNQR
jgi:hypothetical protein